MVNIAIIGAGFMGKTHAVAHREIDNSNIIAIVDRVEEKGKKLAEEFNAKFYLDIDNLLKDESIDAVDICVPTFVHKDLAIKAANAGKHILCEKPLTLSLEDADEMIEAVERNKVKAMVGHVLRFWPEYIKIREIVNSGKLGESLFGFCERILVPPDWFEENWGLNEKNSGGVPLDLHIHDLDYLIWVFGKPSIVSAQGVYNPKLGGIVHITTNIEFENGKSGFAEGGWGFTGDFPFTMVVRILCESGSIEWIFRAGKNIEERAQSAEVTIYEKDKSAYTIEVDQTDAYFLECKYFVDCIMNDNPIEKATFKDGRASLELALAARESAKEKKIVKF
ncbi:MAG: Gfo/Idh/MocA family oxidoreductase [Actinobacteria bacterium]|nr:Gfo/Idh/MocA family oxidoreductase [Actinomycetota bacterium]